MAAAADDGAGGASGEPRQLLPALRHWASTQPDKVLFTYLGDDGEETRRLTYGDVEAQTRRLAQHILSNTAEGLGVGQGDRVLLVYPPSLDFIVAFLACLRAGVVAVPVYPPDPRRLKKNMYMFASIQASSGARVALTSKQYNWAKRATGIKDVFSKEKAKWPDVKWVVTDGLVDKEAPPRAADEVDGAEPADVAFLQYTSGSTAEPKGVRVTHANLSHNLQTIVRSLEAVDDTVVVSWLPQYHDMGLIGSHLGTLYCGGSGAYMSPISFIKNPAVWIASVSKYHGTHLQAPSFAYKLTARKFASQSRWKAADLDLSSVRHIFNAAEPIDYVAVKQFCDTFAPAKLSPAAFSPGYGLAEHTVYVSDSGTLVLHVAKEELETANAVTVIAEHGLTGEAPAAAGDADVAESVLVSCGKVDKNADVDIRIVDRESLAELPDGRVGEIWIDSPSKADGYWGQPEKSAADFHGALAAAGGDGGGESKGGEGRPAAADGYLRTGDLGFVYKGELFVCGRAKDLIIVRGRNHYPQDIERCIEEDDRLRPGCSAAIDAPHKGQEVLVVVAELRDAKCASTDEVLAGAVSAISGQHGVTPYEVVLVEPRSINKTTSGKIARQWVKKAYLAGTLKVVAVWNEKSRGGGAAATRARGGAGGAAAATGDAGAAAPRARPHELDAATIAKAKAMSDEELRAAVADEIGRLLELDPEDIDRTKCLVDLGMDSMALTQLHGELEHRYALFFTEAEMFSEETTVDWMVAQRGRTEKPAEEAAEELPTDGSGPPAPKRRAPPPAMKQPCCPWCPAWCNCL
uniref:Carrier domain-containing protein n=1 Tax=Bicosoecida sp. CB-2014 TaxID=1486930 RepID=A0A7S1C448_9STRA|mmetsp:Transcript_10848/g.37799  ORF Transcript_10848/g.37799 Transcript_10848/m.37799 type:complete len:803 (+) Transcript_10848:133-2541(+)